MRRRGGLAVHPVTDSDIERLMARRQQRRRLGAGAGFLWDDLRASVAVPASGLDYSQILAIRYAARAKVQGAVQGTVNQTTIVRDLAAYDVTNVANGVARYARNSNKNALVAATWFTNDNGGFALANNKAIAVLGYNALTAAGSIDAIRFTLGGVVAVGQFWLAPVYCDLVARIVYFDPPIVIAPGQFMQYDLLAEAAVAGAAEKFQLLGYTSEPATLTVLPDQANLA